MGYSTPKPPFDLADFLSQPAKSIPRKRFGQPRPPTRPASEAQPAEESKAEE